jgi:hypothetical protein
LENRFRSATAFNLLPNFGLNEIDKIKDFAFDPINSHEGYIFSNYSENNNNFYFQYLRKVPVSYGEYNEGFIKKKGEILKETSFEIDFKNKIILVFAGKAQSNFFIRKFTSHFGLFTSSFKLDFSKKIDFLTDSQFIIRSEQVVINGFTYKELMVGRYIANIKDIDVFKKVLNKYRTNIEKITISIEDDCGNILKVKIDEHGTFSFGKYREENANILNFLILTMLHGDL